ncbi:MAG: FecR family protein, partial [Bacteroidota bacterium]
MNSDRIWTLFARKLAEESSPEELVELEVLLKEDPHAHLKIQVLEESWNKIDNPDKHEPETEYQRLTQKLKEQGFNIPITDDTENINGIPVVVNRFKKITGLIAALVFIVAAGLGTIFILNNGESKVNSTFVTNSINAISTKYGSRSKVELPDGSVVWLNSGSKLTYGKQFGASLREVNLSGEGFFDVVHNAGKPFIIHTAFFDIKDLGTRFNVKCYQEDKTTETSLIEGSVEVTLKKNPAKKYVLTPDYKLVLFNEEIKAESVKF